MIAFMQIADTEVTSLTEDETGVLAKLRSTVEASLVCPYCNGERVRNGTRKIFVRDVPQNGKQAEIEWRRQKFICPRCSRSSHDAHPAFDKHHMVTARFVDWIGDEGTKVTFASLSKQSGVNEKVIRQIFGATKPETGASDEVKILGIEKLKVAGSLYPALIDAWKQKVLDVFSSEDALLTDLEISNSFSDRETLPTQTIVRDIELPDTIIDFFPSSAEHIISRTSLHRCVVKMIEAQITPFLDSLRAEKRQSNIANLALFRKRRSGLGRTARNRFKSWQDRCPPLLQMYDLKEHFLSMWSLYTNPTEAEWSAWKHQANSLGLDLNAFIERIDSNKRAIELFTSKPVLCFSYPNFLEKAQQIDKASTHSFSASRTILLQSQRK